MAKTITEGFPIKTANGIMVNTSLPSDSRHIYSYSSRNVKYIAMHYTGNPSDTAKGNANYFNTGYRKSSAHYFVDNNDIYQSVALNNAAWAVGGTDTYKHRECRNVNSVSIEMCCSGNYVVSEKTEINAAQLCAVLCKYIGITANEVDKYVLRHWDVWDKQCPAGWTGNNNARWIAFKNRVKKMLSGSNTEELTMTQYEELNSKITELKKATMVYNYMDDNMPSWAKPTIQKLMDKGYIKGDDTGKLGLTMDMIKMFVVNDRAGLYN